MADQLSPVQATDLAGILEPNYRYRRQENVVEMDDGSGNGDEEESVSNFQVFLGLLSVALTNIQMSIQDTVTGVCFQNGCFGENDTLPQCFICVANNIPPRSPFTASDFPSSDLPLK